MEEGKGTSLYSQIVWLHQMRLFPKKDYAFCMKRARGHKCFGTATSPVSELINLGLTFLSIGF